MKRISRRNLQSGFTLLELLTSVTVFLLIAGAAFQLLLVSQKRYQTESQILNSFQEARLGLDEIVRDVNDAGFPERSQFAGSVNPAANLYASTAFAWNPNYPSTSCAVSVSCSTPSAYDLIVETNINPQGGNVVSWVRYLLQGSTLYRGITNKVAGANPVTATSALGVMVPYVQNVMNNASAAQIAQIRAVYPQMFPAGNPVPIFTYFCDTANGPQPCTGAGVNNSASNIRDIEITLIVMAPQPDAQTGNVRLVTLRGRGHRVNP